MEKNEKSKEKSKDNAGLNWFHCVEYHTNLARWYQFGWKGIIERDLIDFAMYGDIVSQAYLNGLYKGLPPAGKAEFQMPHYLERLLLAHIERLNEILCILAKEGRRGACRTLWEQALKLNQTFSELALKNPGPFRPYARHSLYMPSIRTKNPKFTADAKAIAEAIELSAETVGDNLTDNRTRIGALTARLVGECIDEIKLSRGHWENLYLPYRLPVVWPLSDQIKPFLNKSVDELIQAGRGKIGQEKTAEEKLDSHLRFFGMLKGCGVDRLHFLLLPELTKETAMAWWKGAIEKMIDSKFPRLLEEPHWEKELRAISRGTKADMRKELKDYCVGKVKQFAPKIIASREVAHRQGK